jgi:predicted O-methyltransferase YrrM
MLNASRQHLVDQVPGFLSQAEGEALYRAATSVAQLGCILEIGSYCGKSTVFLGSAAEQSGNLVFALDHHQGSVEHQPGEFFFDPRLTDSSGKTDTLHTFRQTLKAAELNHSVVALVGDAVGIGRRWQQRLGMIFIDGGHSMKDAVNDYRLWSGHVALGGLLAVHDNYASASAGGQAPKAIIDAALQSGLWDLVQSCDSLKVLRRLGA